MLRRSGEKQPGSANADEFSNCSDHFSATLTILQPTIVILQGKAVETWTSTVLERGRIYDRFHYEAHLGSHRMIVCAFSHPSAHGDLGWGDKPTAPYLKTIVAPPYERHCVGLNAPRTSCPKARESNGEC